MILSRLRKPAFTLVLVCVVFAASVAVAGAPPNQALIFEGPGGRVGLTSWTLRRDPANVGLTQGWQSGEFSGATVNVPNVVNPTPYSGHAGGLNYEGSVAWYMTTYDAAQAGTYVLSFQSANYRATVWVDGHELGSHRGSYLPFEMRAKLAAGKHTITVRTDWRDPAQQSREGFHRTWFNWGGLDGEVDIRPVGESELSDPTIQTSLTPYTPQAARARVLVSVIVHNYGPARTLAPTGSLESGSQLAELAFSPVTVAHGASAVAIGTAKVAQPALWSPQSPNLYQLTIALGGESSYSARVGLRQLRWHGGHVYLNGALLKLHGASIQEDAEGHGDALTPADQDTLVTELKTIDANVVRTQHPLDAGLLERLDAAGIMVWQGIGPVEGAGNWYSTTPRLDQEAEQQAHTAVLAEQLHPSIFAWNLVDEIAGNGRDSAEVRYVRDLTKWLHQHDPTRPVAVDVWGDHPPRHAGSLYSEVDAVAETDYSGWYDSPHDTLAQLESLIRSRLHAMEVTFPHKVLVVSEFGAESNGLNPEGTPGSYSFQAKLLAEHIAVYAVDSHLTAMMAWVLRDYPLNPTFSGGSIHGELPKLKLIEGINQKGLFSYGGEAKPGVVSTVARLYAELK